MKCLLITLVASLCVSCASVPAPAPMGPDSAGLAVLIEGYAPIAIFTEAMPQVFFVNLDSTEEAGLESRAVLRSNFDADGYAYLLNVPPGRYVAVACSLEKEFGDSTAEPTASTRGDTAYSASASIGPDSARYATFFCADMIEQTATSVEPGRVTFMGELDVDMSHGLDDADAVQRHYFGQFLPGDQNRSELASIMSGSFSYSGSLRRFSRTDQAKQEFLEAARDHLAESGWLTRLE